MQAGHRDLRWNEPEWNWLSSTLLVAAALAESGYDFRLVLGRVYGLWRFLLHGGVSNEVGLWPDDARHDAENGTHAESRSRPAAPYRMVRRDLAARAPRLSPSALLRLT